MSRFPVAYQVCEDVRTDVRNPPRVIWVECFSATRSLLAVRDDLQLLSSERWPQEEQVRPPVVFFHPRLAVLGLGVQVWVCVFLSIGVSSPHGPALPLDGCAVVGKVAQGRPHRWEIRGKAGRGGSAPHGCAVVTQ